MAAPKSPGPNDPGNPAARTDADLNDPLGDLLPQPVYQVLRNYFLKPHDTVHVTRYFLHEWFTRLGLQRWLLVLLLRESVDPSSQQGLVRITREELAGYLECSEKTISDLLRHIPHPTRKGWRVIDPNGPDGDPDPRRKALRRFIPRLRYWYEKDPNSDAPPKRRGFIIAVSMDDPLTPEDEARIRSLSLEQIGNIVAGDIDAARRSAAQAGAEPKRAKDFSEGPPEEAHTLLGASPEEKTDLLGVLPKRLSDLLGDSLKGKSDLSERLKGSNDPISLTLTELTKYIQEDMDRTLTSTRDIRRAVAPIVQLAEDILADYHSTGMFYKTLYALYPDSLDLFLAAIQEASEIGRVDQHANLGAIFVESIKALTGEAGVDLGFAGSASEMDGSSMAMAEGDKAPESAPNDGEMETDGDGWTADTLWQVALSSLELQMPKATFNTWLHGTQGIDWDGEQLVVELRSTQAREWVENRMQPKIVYSVSDLVGHDVQVTYACRSME